MSFGDCDIKYKSSDITHSAEDQSTPKKTQIRIDAALSLALLTHGSSDGLTHCSIIGGGFDVNKPTVFLCDSSATHVVMHSA